MKLVSAGNPKWAISSRTTGEVLTASTRGPGIEVVLLGVPSGFSAEEASGWLNDIIGVAAETTGRDDRTRAIPTLLHHSLTGMLFTHAELWSAGSEPTPCSVAFVTSPDGPAFGWVGHVNVSVTVNGRVTVPIWVRVRDDAGREALATSFSPGDHVELQIDWGGGRAEPPLVLLEAEYSRFTASPVVTSAPAIPTSATPPAPPTPPAPAAFPSRPSAPLPSAWSTAPRLNPLAPPPIASAVGAPPALPADLPTDRPALASPLELEAPFIEPVRRVAPETPTEPPHPFAPTPAPELPVGDLVAPSDAEWIAPEAPPEWTPDAPALETNAPIEPSSESPWEDSAATGRPGRFEELAPNEPHPVQRWLSRLLNWGRKEPVPAKGTPLEDSSPWGSRVEAAQLESAPREPVAPPEWVNPLPMEDVSAAPDEAVSPLPSPAAHHGPPLFPWPAPASDTQTPTASTAPNTEAAPAADPATPKHEPKPAALRPAGAAEILGSGRLPVGPLEIESRNPGELTDAQISHLPRLSPEVTPSGDALSVSHEPVGAADNFSIARLPHHLQGPAEVDARDSTLGPPPLPSPPSVEARSEPLIIETHVGGRVEPERREIPANTRPAAEPVEAWPGSPRGDQSGAFALPDWAHPRTTADADAATSVAPADHVAPPRSWPVTDAATTTRVPRNWRAYAPWVAGVLALFAIGWFIGGFQHEAPRPSAQTPRWMRAIGLGGARFDATIDSWPNGAWIKLDGRDIGLRTPARVDLPPGEHKVELTMPDLGTASFTLQGRKGENLHAIYPMTGALEVRSADASLPLRVSVDGREQGYAPVQLDSLAPGLHEVAFVGPGMPSWAQTVQVRVHETAQVVAEPMTSPGTGLLKVEAQISDDEGTAPLSGAQVWIDGEPRGRTPLSLEVPRGPHSVRVAWQEQTAPVQVIDLPGGNQRFAMFNLGLGAGAPELSLVSPPRSLIAGRENPVNVSITNVTPGDVRESWLHVRGPEGVWRRYALTPARGPRGVLLTGDYPTTTFDSSGHGRWYVSVITVQGDEYYSEIQNSTVSGAAPR